MVFSMPRSAGAMKRSFVRRNFNGINGLTDNHARKFIRGLDQFEQEAESFGDIVDIGTIAAACVCGYMDFRYADENWRDGRPALAAWFETFSKRPSIVATAPE